MSSAPVCEHCGAIWENDDVCVHRIEGYRRECREVEQRLGAALGYPKDPGRDTVCVGDHTPGTIAAEAASRIERFTRALRPFAEAYDAPSPERAITLADLCKAKEALDWRKEWQ